MPTFILAIVCLVLIFVLYIVSGGWRKYGGVLGVFKWVGGTLNSSSSRHFHSRTQEHRDSSGSGLREDTEVVEVLRQVYQEFEDKHHQMEQTVQRLAQEVNLLKSQINAPPNVEVRSHSEHGSSHPVHQDQSKQNLYFRILDLLESGETEKEIAEMLSVSYSDVSYVRRIMFEPTRR